MRLEAVSWHQEARKGNEHSMKPPSSSTLTPQEERWQQAGKVLARVERTQRSVVSGYVYFIVCGQYLKIGHSLDHPRARMRAIATLNPYPCELIGILEGGRGREREIQTQFSDQRHAGEWFHVTPDLLAFAAEACGEWLHLDRPARFARPRRTS